MELGDYRVEIIPDTEFWLDGGAMFGVVPRVLWERVCPPDDKNRVRLTCNCIFIDTGKQKILIETGMGEKWSAKETAIYGIDRERSFAGSLGEIAGCDVNQIDLVVNTHLHFDHAGGNTVRGMDDTSPDGEDLSRDVIKPVPQFPNARYLVSEKEFEHASSPHERDRASYLSDDWKPLVESGQIALMPESYEAVPGLKVHQVRGHSETMQTIRLERGGQTLVGFFDLIPTRHHLSLAWIMSYDLFPTETLEYKKRILPQALRENWICHFYHDVDMPLARLAEVDGKVRPVDLGLEH